MAGRLTATLTPIGPGTGMSMGNGKPLFRNVKWHRGKL